MQVLIQQLLNGMVSGGVYALIAVGLTMIFGILDIVNFAHGEFYMVGGYLAYLFAVLLHLPYPLVFIFSICGGVIIGLIAERLVFRPIRGKAHSNSVIASMGLSMILANGALMIFTPTPQHIPPPFPDTSVQILGLNFGLLRGFVLIVAVILIVALTLIVERTWMGIAMRSVAQDLVVARLMGIDIDWVSRVTFGLGSGLAAAAGVLVGPLLDVDPNMGSMAGIKAFAVVNMGGNGSITGANIA